MLEPTLAFQTAVRATLIAAPGVLALVPADNIRAGSTRPERTPTIIIGDGRVTYAGRASGGQLVARVGLALHVWAIEDGADTAKAIGHAACTALTDAPATEGFDLDEFAMPGMVWMRDPQPERSYTHGVLNLEAVLRWRI